MRRRIAIAALFVVAASTNFCMAADPRYPDWPCVQAKVPEISLAAVWAGPPLDDASTNWKNDPKVAAFTRREYHRRVNVAASRARDQLWIFHSVRPGSLPADDARGLLLTYALNLAPAEEVADLAVRCESDGSLVHESYLSCHEASFLKGLDRLNLPASISCLEARTAGTSTPKAQHTV